MKTYVTLALAIALSAGAATAFAQGGPRGPSPAAPPMTNPMAGMPASGVISSEMEAKARLEAAGYRNIGPLVRSTDGMWQGTAIRNAASLNVMLSDRGEINVR